MLRPQAILKVEADLAQIGAAERFGGNQQIDVAAAGVRVGPGAEKINAGARVAAGHDRLDGCALFRLESHESDHDAPRGGRKAGVLRRSKQNRREHVRFWIDFSLPRRVHPGRPTKSR